VLSGVRRRREFRIRDDDIKQLQIRIGICIGVAFLV
jgi:hypothetical protein